MKRPKSAPTAPGVYWLEQEGSEPQIIVVCVDGGGWIGFKPGTDEIFYITRPTWMELKDWQRRNYLQGQWTGPLEHPK